MRLKLVGWVNDASIRQMEPMFPLPPGQSQKPPPALVLWIVWLALTTSIPIYQLVLGKGLPQGANAPGTGFGPVVVMAVGQILVAAVLRWLVLPRVGRAPQMLVVMIVGLVLSEAVEFYGLFLISPDQPETKLSLFLLSLLSCVQFAPIYARSGPASLLRLGAQQGTDRNP